MKTFKIALGIFVMYLTMILFAMSVNYGLCNGHDPFMELFTKVSICYIVCLVFIFLFKMIFWCFSEESLKPKEMLSMLESYDSARNKLKTISKEIELDVSVSKLSGLVEDLEIVAKGLEGEQLQMVNNRIAIIKRVIEKVKKL